MAQTIAELEKERADVLKAIQTQAQQMSGQGKTSGSTTEHSLNDWLNAAEEVMPTQTNTRRTTTTGRGSKPTSQKPQPVNKVKSNKASFFGVVIMLSLLLTVLGVIYIAYTSIHNELQKVLANNEVAMKEVKSMQDAIATLEKSIASGGQSDAFEQLQKKVMALEAIINELTAHQTALESSALLSTSSAQSNLKSDTNSQAIQTELDQQLKTYTEEINVKLELIMQRLNIALPAKKIVAEKQQPIVQSKPQVSSQSSSIAPKAPKTQPIMTINQPEAPVTPVVKKVKPLNQPVVSLVKKVEAPVSPVKPDTPVKHYSEDVKWLQKQPIFNYTMQLASMPDKASLQKIIEDKGYKNVSIIPQERAGKTQYILIYGSFSNKTEANKVSKSYQAKYQISPWVRKIKDLVAKL